MENTTKTYNFANVFCPDKIATVCPDGQTTMANFSKSVKADFEKIEEIKEYQKAMSVFLYEGGLTENQQSYKSKLCASICAEFTKKFKVFSLKPVKNSSEKNRIIGFELVQLAISLEDEKVIKDLLSLQARELFGFITGLTYEGLKAEILTYDVRQKEMIILAEKNRLEKVRIEKVQDEIGAMESALTTLKLHKLPTKGMAEKIGELRLSIA
jgi:hypothetical protein